VNKWHAKLQECPPLTPLWAIVDDDMKMDLDGKKLKQRRGRKVEKKKSHMEDNYPLYLQVQYYSTICNIESWMSVLLIFVVRSMFHIGLAEILNTVWIYFRDPILWILHIGYLCGKYT